MLSLPGVSFISPFTDDLFTSCVFFLVLSLLQLAYANLNYSSRCYLPVTILWRSSQGTVPPSLSLTHQCNPSSL